MANSIKSGQFNRQYDPEMEGPSIKKGINTRMARKRSKARLKNTKMDLNFKGISPIIVYA